jgi:hypothetical protein
MKGHFWFLSPCWDEYVSKAFPVQCFPFQGVHSNPPTLGEEEKNQQFLLEEPLQLLVLQAAVVYFQFPLAQ